MIHFSTIISVFSYFNDAVRGLGEMKKGVSWLVNIYKLKINDQFLLENVEASNTNSHPPRPELPPRHIHY